MQPKIDLGSLKWIDFKEQRPGWGYQVLVYRGGYDTPDRWKFQNLPPVYEVTDKFDNGITHWAWLVKPALENGTQNP